MDAKVRVTSQKAYFAVYELCNEKRYFTCGGTTAYEKMFELVKMGRPLNEIAAIIWACSDSEVSYEEVYNNLEEILYVVPEVTTFN